MKTKGLKVYTIAPSDAGFGVWQSTEVAFVRKDSITYRPGLDGLIMNQTGKAVEALSADGDPVVGMLA